MNADSIFFMCVAAVIAPAIFAVRSVIFRRLEILENESARRHKHLLEEGETQQFLSGARARELEAEARLSAARVIEENARSKRLETDAIAQERLLAVEKGRALIAEKRLPAIDKMIEAEKELLTIRERSAALQDRIEGSKKGKKT